MSCKNIVLPTRKEIKIIEECIRGVIRGRDLSELRALLEPVICNLIDRKSDKVLLGCTELSVLFGAVKDPRLVDPLTIITKILLPL